MPSIRITDKTLNRFKTLADGRPGDFFVNKLLDYYENLLATPVALSVTSPAPTKPDIPEMTEILDADALSFLQDQGTIELDLEKIFGDGLWDDDKLNSLKVQVRGKELGATVFGKWEKLGVIL